MTVEQLLSNIDSVEMSEWLAYFELEAERDQPSDEDALKKAFNCG